MRLCGVDRIGSGREGGRDRICHGPEQHATMILDGSTEQREVPRDSLGHGLSARSQSTALPSISVKRKVTVPLGSSGMFRSRRSPGRGSARLSHGNAGINAEAYRVGALPLK